MWLVLGKAFAFARLVHVAGGPQMESGLSSSQWDVVCMSVDIGVCCRGF